MSAAPPRQVSVKLMNAVDKLVRDTVGSQKASFEEKRKVLELALKLEAIKLKVDPRQFGSAFFDEGEGADDADVT